MNVLQRELDPLVVGYLHSPDPHTSNVQASELQEMNFKRKKELKNFVKKLGEKEDGLKDETERDLRSERGIGEGERGGERGRWV